MSHRLAPGLAAVLLSASIIAVAAPQFPLTKTVIQALRVRAPR